MCNQANAYDLGATVRVSVTFTLIDGSTLVDPDSVKLFTRRPASEKQERTPIVHDATGHYYCDVTAEEPGSYRYRWEGFSSDFEAVSEGTFYVRSDI